MKEKFKKKLVRIIPFMLVGILTSSAIFFSYDKGNEVKAVAGVDDIMIVTALLALCGVTYVGTQYEWSDNYWSPDTNPETREWARGFNERMRKQWDEEVRKEAIKQGLIDEDGNILDSGGSGGGSDDDNDNKFPTWEKLKTTIKAVSAKGGNIATALGAYLPFVALFGYGTLAHIEGTTSGSKDSFSELQNGVNELLSSKNIDTSVYSHSVETMRNAKNSSGSWQEYEAYYFNDGYFYYNSSGQVCFKFSNSYLHIQYDTRPDGNHYAVADSSSWVTGGFANTASYKYFHVVGDIFSSKDEAEEKYNDSQQKSKYINPNTISENTDLKNKRKTGEGTIDFPTLPIYPDFLKLPSTSDLEDFFRNIGKDNENNDKDKKQKDIDDFIRKLTTNDTGKDPSTDPGKDPSTDPGKDPSTDPGKDPSTDPGKDPSTDPGKDPSTDPDPDNESFLTDLKELFPFCIPFDIVDCFKLFNAEPETPRVEFPIHFGIINKDYTFVIDLKDFNDVAGVCRSSFLTLFIVGLAFATSKVIKW